MLGCGYAIITVGVPFSFAFAPTSSDVRLLSRANRRPTLGAAPPNSPRIWHSQSGQPGVLAAPNRSNPIIPQSVVFQLKRFIVRHAGNPSMSIEQTITHLRSLSILL